MTTGTSRQIGMLVPHKDIHYSLSIDGRHEKNFCEGNLGLAFEDKRLWMFEAEGLCLKMPVCNRV